MSRSVCARLLWLVAVLVAQAQADRRVPDCPNNYNCEWIRAVVDEVTGYTYDEFSIRSTRTGPYIPFSIKIHGEVEEFYRAECDKLYLMEPGWPRFSTPLIVKTAEIVGCHDTGISYGLALQELRVNVTDKLRVLNLDEDSKIGAYSFRDLPSSVKELELSKPDGVLLLNEGALGNLQNLRKLILSNVQPKDLPPNLDELQLWETGLKSLPVNQLNVSKLTIKEMKLESIMLSVPNLRSLTIRNTPKLTSVQLNDAPLEMMHMLFEWCGPLKSVVFVRSKAESLPSRLLGHVALLTAFAFTDGQITTLPVTFFSDNKKLWYINLSGNNLQSLPIGLFNDLPTLTEVRLADNCLAATELRALAPVRALQWLNLNGNPLDLCSADLSALSSLTSLENLYLSRTRVNRVCAEILQALPALRYLDLRDNSIRDAFSCANVFASTLASGSDNVVIDISENMMQRMSCYNETPVNTQLPYKLAVLATDEHVQCNCHCPNALCLPVSYLRIGSLKNK